MPSTIELVGQKISAIYFYEALSSVRVIWRRNNRRLEFLDHVEKWTTIREQLKRTIFRRDIDTVMSIEIKLIILKFLIVKQVNIRKFIMYIILQFIYILNNRAIT